MSAIILEVAGTTSMKLSQGFSRASPSMRNKINLIGGFEDEED